MASLHNKSTVHFSDFVPLVIIFTVIIFITLGLQWYHGFSSMSAMNDFMATFFLIFGFFKLVNWSGFVQAYRMYDIIAQRSIVYAYAYPLIEIMLGLLYAFRIYPVMANGITIVVMLISSMGVAQQMRKKENVQCACLGTVFTLPMTYVSLLEDILMALMALCMLLMHYV